MEGKWGDIALQEGQEGQENAKSQENEEIINPKIVNPEIVNNIIYIIMKLIWMISSFN